LTKPRAVCLIRPQVHYRREAFLAGLEAAGYEVVDQEPSDIRPDDRLIMWNSYGAYHQQQLRWEARGGRAIITENGYWGKDGKGRQPYAIALDGHQGSGKWYSGGYNEALVKSRLMANPVRFKPFQINRPGYALVCGQRGIGTPEMASPNGWDSDVANQLVKLGWDVNVRPHPELLKRRGVEPVPLHKDLAGASIVVVWSSNVAVQSLAEGIPTIYCAPHHVLGRAMMRECIAPDERQRWTAAELDAERYIAFCRAAWAQWFVGEIAKGIPFEHLKGVA